MIYIVWIAIALFFIWLFKKYKVTSKQLPSGVKEAPLVKGSLPFIGHGLLFYKDIVGFMRNCYKEYGPVFKIKIFRSNFMVICDRNIANEFFKADESELSLYNVLNKLYFQDAFFDNPKDFVIMVPIIKSTISVRFSEFVPKIKEESLKMIERIKSKQGTKINLTDEMMIFVARTSAKCFLNEDPSDEFIKYLIKLTNLLNFIVVLTYFFPKFVLKNTLGVVLRYYRRTMTRMLNPLIQKYLDNPDLKDSMVIRAAADFEIDGKKKFGRDEIGDIIVCLLYISSANTALGALSTIVELTKCPDYWEEIKSITENSDEEILSIEEKDIDAEEKEKCLKAVEEKFMKNEIIDSCVMETARLNSHILSLNRNPVKNDYILGDYYISDVDTVAICEPMLMCYECSGDKYADAQIYDPSRFLKPRSEPKDAKSVMTWGAGRHLCPGKMFALMEQKEITGRFTEKFFIPRIDPNEYSEKNHFSSSALAERKINVYLEPIETIKLRELNLEIIKSRNAWILKNFLDIQKQINLLQDTREETWFKLANEIDEFLHQKGLDYPFKRIKPHTLKTDLIDENSEKKLEQNNGYSIIITIGDKCMYILDRSYVYLKSGDILISSYDRAVDHCVEYIIPDSCPAGLKGITKKTLKVKIN